MPNFDIGDVVRVPFPYTNRETTQRRPALVISAPTLASGMLTWVLMITSSANRSWPGDIAIASPSDRTGLPVPSIVRTAKIATIETSIAERIGSLSPTELKSVQNELLRVLGLN